MCEQPTREGLDKNPPIDSAISLVLWLIWPAATASWNLEKGLFTQFYHWEVVVKRLFEDRFASEKRWQNHLARAVEWVEWGTNVIWWLSLMIDFSQVTPGTTKEAHWHNHWITQLWKASHILAHSPQRFFFMWLAKILKIKSSNSFIAQGSGPQLNLSP